MWKSIQFAKTTVVGGFFIVLPIALAAIILTYMVGIVADTIEPLLEGVPVDEIGGVGIAIFVPLAPTPTVGTVYIGERANVERIEAGTPAALNCLMQWGIGAREILTRRQ